MQCLHKKSFLLSNSEHQSVLTPFFLDVQKHAADKAATENRDVTVQDREGVAAGRPTGTTGTGAGFLLLPSLFLLSSCCQRIALTRLRPFYFLNGNKMDWCSEYSPVPSPMNNVVLLLLQATLTPPGAPPELATTILGPLLV